MASEHGNQAQAAFPLLVSGARDAVSLLRDASLLLLAILLIGFPTKLNSILENAGFVEGTVAGFKWQSKLAESTSSLKEAQSTIADLQEKNDEMSKALIEANAKLSDPSFRERVTTLERENTQLKASADQVQSAVKATILSNASLLEKAQVQRPLSDYLVGVQTLGVPDEVRIELNEKLRASGYGMHDISVSFAQRPPWLAQHSTVLYYATSALPAAQQLAQTLKRLTGDDFALQRGNGLGVDPAQRDVTLFVHYVKA